MVSSITMEAEAKVAGGHMAFVRALAAAFAVACALSLAFAGNTAWADGGDAAEQPGVAEPAGGQAAEPAEAVLPSDASVESEGSDTSDDPIAPADQDAPESASDDMGTSDGSEGESAIDESGAPTAPMSDADDADAETAGEADEHVPAAADDTDDTETVENAIEQSVTTEPEQDDAAPVASDDAGDAQAGSKQSVAAVSKAQAKSAAASAETAKQPAPAVSKPVVTAASAKAKKAGSSQKSVSKSSASAQAAKRAEKTAKAVSAAEARMADANIKPQSSKLAVASSSKKGTVKRLPSGVYLIKPRTAVGGALGIEKSSYFSKALIKVGKMNGTYSRMFYFKRNKDGYYSIISLHSGLALTASGKSFVQAAYKGKSSQRFKVVQKADGSYTLVSKSGKAMSVAGPGKAARTAKASSKVSQRFKLVESPIIVPGVYELRSAKFLSQAAGPVDGSLKSSATTALNKKAHGVGKMVLSRANGGYTVRALGSGTYMAASGSAVKQSKKAFVWNAGFAKGGERRGIVFTAKNGKSVSVTGSSKKLAMKKGASRLQAFIPVKTSLVDEGTYLFRAVSGKLLDVDGGTYANGGNIQVWSKGDTSSQLFKVEKRDGAYVITSARTLKALTSSDGNVVQQWYDNAPSQQWRAVVNGKGAVVFVNMATGNALGVTNKAKEDGSNVRDAGIGSLASGWALAPRDDYSLTGNADLDRAVSSILENRQSLSSAFWYVTGNYHYRGQNRLYNFGDFLSDEDLADFAWDMYDHGSGNCYRFAALFCVLARALDYDANVRLGYFLLGGSTAQTHGWVEVYDGGTSVYDVEMTAEYSGAGYVVAGTSYGYASGVASSFGCGGYYY